MENLKFGNQTETSGLKVQGKGKKGGEEGFHVSFPSKNSTSFFVSILKWKLGPEKLA
jgi:hypothetical protein